MRQGLCREPLWESSPGDGRKKGENNGEGRRNDEKRLQWSEFLTWKVGNPTHTCQCTVKHYSDTNQILKWYILKDLFQYKYMSYGSCTQFNSSCWVLLSGLCTSCVNVYCRMTLNCIGDNMCCCLNLFCTSVQYLKRAIAVNIN